MGVGHGLECGEGFGGDDEQRLIRIQIDDGFGEIRSVDVRNKAECHGAVAVIAQRFIRHDRAKVGTADADVHHVADTFDGMDFPLARAHAVTERRHLVQHLMHGRNDVFAVDENRRCLRRPQSRMQHGPLLRDVDLFAAEHGVNAVAQA